MLDIYDDLFHLFTDFECYYRHVVTLFGLGFSSLPKWVV